MKPDVQCGLCILEWVYGRATAQEGRDILPLYRGLARLLSREMRNSANIGRVCNRAVGLARRFILPQSPFWEKLKEATNLYVRGLMPQAAAFIAGACTQEERFYRACALAAAGNVSPLGAPAEGAFAFPEVLSFMKGDGPGPFFLGDAWGAARLAHRVLYVTDNAGEIGLDALLISCLKDMGLAVTLVVKEPAYFEDATLADVSFFGLERLADEVVTVDKVFLPGGRKGRAAQAFKAGDLLIVKGTGNYEALRGATGGKKAIFLLKIKCDPIAGDTGVPMGSIVVRCGN